MLPKSNSLFHFTKSLDYLKSILTSGFLPRYSLEDTELVGIEYTAYPMICFCDIPISRIAEHTAFYGQYGLGMTRDWGMRNGLHPLIYGVPGGRVAKSLMALEKISDERGRDSQKVANLRDAVMDEFFSILPLLKPVTGKMIVAGEIFEKDFTQENEWRYVAGQYRIAYRDDYDRRKNELNAEVSTLALQFSPSDVRHLFVKSDHEIPALFDFIQARMGKFPMNDVKILTSRISSLETLERDI